MYANNVIPPKLFSAIIKDGSVDFTANQSMAGFRIIDAQDPVNSQDYATKSFVQALINTGSWKVTAKAATTGNIVLSGAQTVDGVTLVDGVDRVLVKEQTLLEENGIYLYNDSGAWTRTTDADTAIELNGASISVRDGVNHAEQAFNQPNEIVTLGTDDIKWIFMTTMGNAILRDGSIAYIGNQSFGGNNITNVALINGAVISSSGLATRFLNETGVYSAPAFIGGSITDNQVAFGSSVANEIEGSSGFTFDSNNLTIPGQLLTPTEIHIGSAVATAQGTDSVGIGTGAGLTNQGVGATALGSRAGETSQGASGIAIGIVAGKNTQGADGIAIGRQAGEELQSLGSIAIGAFSGFMSQGVKAVAVGFKAGETTQADSCIAIGNLAGTSLQDLGAIAIGDGAGETSQGEKSVAVGFNAGTATQGDFAIAIGDGSGLSLQSTRAVAVGRLSGNTNQGESATALGNDAGVINQSASATAVGHLAGTNTQGINAVAVGHSAGEISQGATAVAIGHLSGNDTQALLAIAIGNQAGETMQAANGIAIGDRAGNINQGINTIAIGLVAGVTSQGASAICIGAQSGETSQGANSVAVGARTAFTGQGIDSVAIGVDAGNSLQGFSSVAVGDTAGNSSQGFLCVAIGQDAGKTSQGDGATTLGAGAGVTNQGISATALGRGAGNFGQGTGAVAIGDQSGATVQGISAVAIGARSGFSGQGNSAVAIGVDAANDAQGISAVAIGHKAGETSQAANGIIISSTGVAENNTTPGHIVLASSLASLKYDGTEWNFLGGDVNFSTTINIRGGLQQKITNITGPTFTIPKTDYMIFVDTTIQDITITLPVIVAGVVDDGRMFRVQKVFDITNKLTITPQAPSVINSETTNTVMGLRNDSISYIASGGDWFINDRDTDAFGAIELVTPGATQSLTGAFTKLAIFDTDRFTTPGICIADQTNDVIIIDNIESLSLGGDGYNLSFRVEVSSFSNNQEISIEIFVNGAPTNIQDVRSVSVGFNTVIEASGIFQITGAPQNVEVRIAASTSALATFETGQLIVQRLGK